MAGLGLQRLQRSAHFAFAKAEVAQRGEDFGSDVERLGLHVATVFRAVGVPDAQGAAFAPVENDLAAMRCTVM